MEGTDADAKRSTKKKTLSVRNKCPPFGSRAGWKEEDFAQQVHVTPSALLISAACPRLLPSRQVCLFLDPVFGVGICAFLASV